jgi:predicted Ser/Thr protein kinase
MQKKEKNAFEIREAALRNKMASNTNSMETLIENVKAYGQKDSRLRQE